jgi:thiol-disulfide isomerase/thioredoxin
VQAQELKPWPGVITPALSLSDLEGKPHRLADYRGKVVLVNFWATWCVPCREEMPSIERLRTSLAGRPFVVLAVNLAEPESRIRKFLEAVPVGFPADRESLAGARAAGDLPRRTRWRGALPALR